MTTGGLSIEMLPARHGDALWIEWEQGNHRHRMLIDGGPTTAYDDVRRRIEQLDADQRRLELLVVTHIDLDHIGGAIELLQDESLGVHYEDIWFNDHHHLSDEPPTRGTLQGDYLANVLIDGGLPWNTAFRGGPVRVEPNRPLPRVRLAGGVTLVLLSPTPEKLLALRGEWSRRSRTAKRKAQERAAEEAGEAVTRGDRIVFGGDSSKANGSSVAVIVEYQDERWLLAATPTTTFCSTGCCSTARRSMSDRYDSTASSSPITAAHGTSRRTCTRRSTAGDSSSRPTARTSNTPTRHAST